MLIHRLLNIVPLFILGRFWRIWHRHHCCGNSRNQKQWKTNLCANIEDNGRSRDINESYFYGGNMPVFFDIKKITMKGRNDV